MRDKLKEIGGAAIGLAIMVGLVVLAVLLLKGTAYVSAWAYPFLTKLFTYTAIIALPFLVLLALPPKTRGLAGTGLFACSFVFGATIWVWALLLTLQIWGWFAVIIGFLFAGVGIIPIAMLAVLFNGMWSVLGQLLLGIVLIFGCRAAGMALMQAATRQQIELASDITINP